MSVAGSATLRHRRLNLSFPLSVSPWPEPLSHSCHQGVAWPHPAGLLFCSVLCMVGGGGAACLTYSELPLERRIFSRTLHLLYVVLWAEGFVHGNKSISFYRPSPRRPL